VAVDKLPAGGTLTDVQRIWNAAGVTTVNGKPWLNLWDIGRTLCAPRLAGLVAHQGKIVGKGNWPAIIGRGTHEALVEALRPRRDHKGKTARRYLLPGYVYCQCGSPMVAQVSDNRSNRYICVRARGGCGKVSRNRPWLETAVRAYVAGRIEAEYEAPEGLDSDDDAAEQEIVELEARIARALGLALDGVFTDKEVSDQVIPMRARITELRAEQARAARQARQVNLEAADLLALWMSEDPTTLHERRAILDDFIERVIVKPLPGRQRWGVALPIPMDSITILPKE
jgi:hypothetical protein